MFSTSRFLTSGFSCSNSSVSNEPFVQNTIRVGTAHASTARSNTARSAWTLCAVAGIAAIACVPSVLLAQGGKPSATPIESSTAYQEPDLKAFKRAYERDDRPTALVLVGFATSQHQANDPASILFNSDATGITQQIKSAIEEVLNAPEADVEMVNINALRASTDRLSGVLQTRGERDAVSLLADDLSAQLVLMVKLHTLDANGTIGKATVEAFRADRARTLFTIAFDWKGGNSAKDLKINGRQIARAFINDYSKRLSGDNRRLTLRILGITDSAQLREARELVEEVAGVEVVRRRSSASARRDGFAQFEITYTGTDSTTLADDAAAALEDRFGPLEVVKDEGGAFTLRPSRRSNSMNIADDERCAQDMALRAAAGDAVRDELRAAARARGNPRVVVLINRDAPFADEPVPADAGQAGNASANTIVISLAENNAAAIGSAGVGSGGGLADRATLESRRREAALQSRLIEDALSDRIGNGLLGLRVVDGDTVRSRLLAKLDTDASTREKPLTEAQLASMMRSDNLADIIIVGTARVRPEGSAVPVASYTFRAIDASSGDVIGSYAAGTVLPLGIDAPVVEEVAQRAAGALGCRMLRAWTIAQPTTNIESSSRNRETSRTNPAPPPTPTTTEPVSTLPATKESTLAPDMVPVPPISPNN